MKINSSKIFILIGSWLGLMLSSCINDKHDYDLCPRDVELIIKQDTSWIPNLNMEMTKSEDYEIEYIFRILEGDGSGPVVKEFTFYSSEIMRPDFSIDIDLKPGEYSIYVWSDLINPDTGKSMFYETSDFASISYRLPYEGDTEQKDAFRGNLNFTISITTKPGSSISKTLVLSRPLGKYEFIATDLEDFIAGHFPESTVDPTALNLEDYSVKISYPLYMPAFFNNYTNQPFNSLKGISYTGKIVPVSSSEAILGFDYVMLPDEDSSVQVMMEFFDSNGEKIGGSSTLTLPMRRNRTTVVKGEFLTSEENAGVHIDTDFEGKFDIEYR